MDENEAKRLSSLMPNDKFCPAPFMHTYINANNRGYKLCCMSHIVERWDTQSPLKEQHEAFWTGETMQEIRQSFMDGEMPDPCKWWCGRIEDEGMYHKSDRLNFIKRYEKEELLKEVEWCIDHGTLNFKKAVDIDLRPSKLCNLKCRSCNSLWSNKIEEEVLANPELQKWSHWDMVTQSKGAMRRAEQIDWNDPNFDVISNLDLTNVVKLAMSGGETLIDPRVHNIVKKVVDSGQAKDMRLHFITNCTSLPTRIYDLISEFKSVTFNISIDGIGATDEYLRHGTRWDRKVDVFHKIFTFPNLHWAGVMHVFQPISAFQVKRNVKWFLEQSRHYEKFDGVTFNPIVDPWYLSVSWLDEDHKDWIRDQVQQCITEFSMDEREQRWFDWLHSELDKTQEDRATRYANDYVRAELALNKVRGTNTLEIEPMLQRYFDRYDPENITPSEHGRPAAQFGGKPKPTASFDGKE